MTSPSTHILHLDCDLCARRRNRLECALKHLEYTRKRSLDDPALSNGFALGGAQRYVDEVRSSHPEHPTNPGPEPEGVQPSKPADEHDETAALDSEYMLKSSFLKQQEIVERMMEIERTRVIMIPGGNKHVDTLRKLAVAMMRKEFEQRKSQTDATD